MQRRPFSKVLKEFRKRAELSQEGLALEAGLDRTAIGRLERGEREPSLQTVFIIAHALRVRASLLISRMER